MVDEIYIIIGRYKAYMMKFTVVGWRWKDWKNNSLCLISIKHVKHEMEPEKLSNKNGELDSMNAFIKVSETI